MSKTLNTISVGHFFNPAETIKAIAQSPANDFRVPPLDALSADIAALYAVSFLSAQEVCSVYAIIAYTAQKKKIDENILRLSVEQEFHVQNIAQIRSRDYDAVVRYLVGLNVREIVN